MAVDALDPGDGSYPHFPRRTDGSPAWSDIPEADGVPVPGRGPGGLVTPMPRGLRHILRDGERVAIDVTPRVGTVLVDPPVVP